MATGLLTTLPSRRYTICMKHADISLNTRSSILDAACSVILEKGAEAFTIEAVARETGISKGGLLYHFPSKKSMIQGMIQRLIDQEESLIEKEISKNGVNFLEAFVRVYIKAGNEQNRISLALFAAIANDIDLLKPLQSRYLEWQNRAEAAAPSPEIGTLVRLAMDGLWFSDLANLAPPSLPLRKKLARILLSMIKKDN
jgi:AcrR family transcriptional regulator